MDGDAVVVTSSDECEKVDPDKTVHLFSQTTMDVDQFREVEEKLRARSSGIAASGFRSQCTICGQMKKRKPGLKMFAGKHDVIVFVSGKNSSNGKLLYEYCLSLNARTHWVSDESEVQLQWFNEAGSIGITGATSTSINQLEAMGAQIRKLVRS